MLLQTSVGRADSRWSYRGHLGYVANSEFALQLAEPGVRVVWPEVMDLECHVGHLLVLLFFCSHFV
jgi:hypothetical protein